MLPMVRLSTASFLSVVAETFNENDYISCTSLRLKDADAGESSGVFFLRLCWQLHNNRKEKCFPSLNSLVLEVIFPRTYQPSSTLIVSLIT